MNHLSVSTIAVAVVAFVSTLSAAVEASQCKVGEFISQGGRYHSDDVCHKAEYNEWKESMGRHERYNSYNKLGSYASVPNEKTVMCPSKEQGEISLQDPSYTTGMDAVWIVENTSDEPVVVAYVTEDGKEVSSRNPSIYPAQDDPDAILEPNAWMPIYSFEGHVFHLRTLTQDGTQGDLVMQHRIGLIPVGQHLASQLVCGREDPEPVVEKITETNEKEIVREEAFAREAPQILRPCNTMDIGFRNMAGCPLNGYYILAEEQVQNGAVANPDDPRLNDGLSSCTEIFRFHLGLEQTHLNDFMWQWQSATKFEGSFIGHSFSFRLASDPSVLVDRITLQPTFVPKCPGLKSKAGTGLGGAQVGENINISDRNNDIETTKTAATGSSTTNKLRGTRRVRRRRELEKIRMELPSSTLASTLVFNETSSLKSTMKKSKKLHSVVSGTGSGNATVSVGVANGGPGVYSY